MSHDDGEKNGLQHSSPPPARANSKAKARHDVTVHSVWRHKKRGSVYTIVGVRRGTVFYCSHADGKLWYRPLDEFADGRFEVAKDGIMPLSPDECGFERG